jgi:ABC-type polysaccharide/polyol phosphate export permease
MSVEQKPTYDTDARKNLVINEIQDLYRYHTLVLHLIRRNVTTRYKRSILGVTWALLDPMATMVIMVVIFSSFFGRFVEAYPVFLFSALVIWNFISQASTGAITDLLGGNWLISKIYIPRTVFAITSVGANLINLLIAKVPLSLLLFFFKMPVSPALLFLPASILINGVFTLGLGLLFSTFSIFFADALNIHNIMMRLLMYLSGIFYVIDSVPPPYRMIVTLNPLYSLVQLFRDPIFHGALPPTWSIVYATCWAVILFCLGLLVFLRYSDQIAYRI